MDGTEGREAEKEGREEGDDDGRSFSRNFFPSGENEEVTPTRENKQQQYNKMDEDVDVDLGSL